MSYVLRVSEAELFSEEEVLVLRAKVIGNELAIVHHLIVGFLRNV